MLWPPCDCERMAALSQLSTILDQTTAYQTEYLPSFDPPVASVAGWDQAP